MQTIPTVETKKFNRNLYAFQRPINIEHIFMGANQKRIKIEKFLSSQNEKGNHTPLAHCSTGTAQSHKFDD